MAALVTEIPPLVYVPCPAYMYSARVGRTILNICIDEIRIENGRPIAFLFLNSHGRVWNSEPATTCHSVPVAGQGTCTCSKMFCQRAKSQRNRCQVGWCMV